MTERRRIAFITNNAGYTPESAMGIYTWILACKLAEKGFDVNYYCIGNFIKPEDVPVNVRILSFPAERFWRSTLKSIKKEGIRVALYHYLATVWGWIGIPYKPPYYIARLKLSGVKVITNFHETSLRWNFTKPWLFAQAVTQRIAAIVMLKSSSAVISSIDSYIRTLVRYNNRIFKIPIATNILPLNNINYDDEYRANFRSKIVSKDEILISCFGNRNYSMLIESVAQLLKLNYKIKVVLIGYISEPHVISVNKLIEQLQIKDNIIFTGLLNQDEVYNYLVSCDMIFSYEGVEKGNEGGASFKSGSLVASFSAGVPIITTKGDLNDDNFETEVPVLLFRPDEPQTLLPIIKDLIDNPEKRIGYGKKAAAFYDSYLSWQRITDRHVEVFNQFV